MPRAPCQITGVCDQSEKNSVSIQSFKIIKKLLYIQSTGIPKEILQVWFQTIVIKQVIIFFAGKRSCLQFKKTPATSVNTGK